MSSDCALCACYNCRAARCPIVRDSHSMCRLSAAWTSDWLSAFCEQQMLKAADDTFRTRMATCGGAYHLRRDERHRASRHCDAMQTQRAVFLLCAQCLHTTRHIKIWPALSTQRRIFHFSYQQVSESRCELCRLPSCELHCICRRLGCVAFCF